MGVKKDRRVFRLWDSGDTQWHISLAGVGFEGSLDAPGSVVRATIARLSKEKQERIQEAARTLDPTLIAEAQKILAAALMEALMKTPK